jgi:hypothetical protein
VIDYGVVNSNAYNEIHKPTLNFGNDFLFENINISIEYFWKDEWYLGITIMLQ